MVQQLKLGEKPEANPTANSSLVQRFSSLGEAKEAARTCERCGLCEGRTNVVFSDGNEHAKLMIIGDGPGQQEDATGVPFVGRAGQLLDKILASAEIDRMQDAYICNIVKCRPPGNRVPMPEEASACRAFLDAQIEYINPRIILLAGATAVQHVLKVKDPISRIRGKWFDFKNGARVMPVFHPSYLLRSDSREVGSPKWHMWQDIKEVRRTLDLVKET